MPLSRWTKALQSGITIVTAVVVEAQPSTHDRVPKEHAYDISALR
jgi:hypothetical protein